MTDGDIKAELRDTWESAAPGWAKWEAVIAAGLVDATDAMLDMAGVDANMRVLDLACGAGSQSLRAAERVGPEGRVLASDISATMLAHVQERAKRNGISNIETLECAAEDLPATQQAFDAAICRLGLMLFPAPKQALKAVQSVLKPQARFAGLVFTISQMGQKLPLTPSYGHDVRAVVGNFLYRYARWLGLAIGARLL